jgi:tetratricopeptide (TPR) repeat protein/tRNA A-37 threonylcarbamoyl transferase component Bud32
MNNPSAQLSGNSPINLAMDLHKAWREGKLTETLAGQGLKRYVRLHLADSGHENVKETLKTIAEERAKFIAKGLGLVEGAPELDHGGYGFVYVATARAVDQKVALKLLHPEYVHPESVDKKDESERFDQEREILKRLRAPFYPKLYYEGTHVQQPYYVMEYGGCDLQKYINDGRLQTLENALGIARAVLEALQHLHGRRIIHRDVKPRNILIDPATLAVRLIDFGSAKAEFSDKETTQPGAAPTTGGYCAPEQANGPGTAESDVYAFGKVLQRQLLPRFGVCDETGADDSAPGPGAASPTAGGNLAPTHTDLPAPPLPPPPVPSDDPRLPRLADLARRCTLNDPEARPAVAAALAEVEGLLAPKHVPAADPPLTGLRRILAAPRIAYRRGLKGWWLLGTSLALLAAGALLGYYASPPDRERDLAVAVAQARLAEARLAARVQADAGTTQGKYDEALDELKRAHDRWPGDEPLLVLLAETHQEVGDYYRGQGRRDEAIDQYDSAIGRRDELVKRFGNEPRYRTGLGLGYGCRGDVNLLVEPADERRARKDYEKSLEIRKQLADEDPANQSLKIQLAIAEGNFARLDGCDPNTWGKSREKWLEVIGFLQGVRDRTRGARDKEQKDIFLNATGEVAFALLDPCSGYFAVLCAVRERGGAAGGLADRDQELVDVAADVTRVLADEHQPNAATQKCAFEYFRARLGRQPTVKDYAGVLTRLEALIPALSALDQRGTKSLYLEVAFSCWKLEHEPADAGLKAQYQTGRQYLDDLSSGSDFFLVAQRKRIQLTDFWTKP